MMTLNRDFEQEATTGVCSYCGRPLELDPDGVFFSSCLSCDSYDEWEAESDDSPVTIPNCPHCGVPMELDAKLDRAEWLAGYWHCVICLYMDSIPISIDLNLLLQPVKGG